MVFVELINALISYVSDFISINLYVGAFLATLIETVFPPIPSELVIPLAGYLASITDHGYLGLIGVSISATLGATLGATIIYYLSLKVGRRFVLKYGKYLLIDKVKVKAAERWFNKHGSKAVFFGRMVPVIRELISIPAGISKMKFKKFFVYTLAGSFVWTIFLASMGYFLGAAWEKIPISNITDMILFFVLIFIIGYFILKHLFKNRKPKKRKVLK